MRAIERCRTEYLGYRIEGCDLCGYERVFYNSCRNRHCPKCQTLAKESWLQDRLAELLPVKYFHNVFTLPHQLNAIALYNKKIVYGILFKAVSETLLEFGRDPKHLGGKLGFLAILHTWDQRMRSHIHLHVVIPEGGLSFDKKQWILPKKKKFLFHVNALSRKFRGKFIAFIKKAFSDGKLTFPEKPREWKTGFEGLINRLWKKDWVVYSKRPFAGPEKVLDYLGRYTHKVAISNHRILSAQNGQVTFKYRDRKDGDKEKTTTIQAEEFIRRFLLHILPSGFVRIRHYGFLANRHKKENIQRCRELIGKPVSLKEKTEESNLEMMQRLTGIDIAKCPFCKEGHMVVIKEIPGPYDYRKKSAHTGKQEFIDTS
jgi:hypothetical protein